MASVLLRKRPIDVRTGEGRLREPAATKIRNGGFLQYRDVTQAGSQPGSRATSTVGSATRRRAEFVALPGSLARSTGTRGRARSCRPRRPRPITAPSGSSVTWQAMPGHFRHLRRARFCRISLRQGCKVEHYRGADWLQPRVQDSQKRWISGERPRVRIPVPFKAVIGWSAL